MPTYYVDGVDGNDANAGTSEGSGNAWATIDHAMNNVVAGDKVWVKGNGTYAEYPVIDTVGTLTAPIHFEGYTTTPGDNGKATVGGSSYGLGSTQANSQYYIFENFVFTGCSSHGVNLATKDAMTFIRCDFYSNGGAGLVTGGATVLVDCNVYNNGDDGVACETFAIMGCKIYGNALFGLDGTGPEILYGSLIYNNTSGACDAWTVMNGPVISNTIDNDGVAIPCINHSNITCRYIFNNILHDGSYGIQTTNVSNRVGYITYYDYNVITSMATGNYSFAVAMPSCYTKNDITGSDPGFTDEAGDDYTLAGSSVALDAGVGIS